MLSYQHIYHAGNFADVQKHAALTALVEALARKPQSFCILDTHAGRGLYDLSSEEAQKVGEFKSGVLPFWEKRSEASPLAAYLKIVAAFNGDGELKKYPGSAKIAQHLMRPADRLLLTEMHPGELEELKKSFEGAPNVSIEKKDGFRQLVDTVPFPERNGLVLIDPSYEIKTEYAAVPKHLQKAYKKWPQGQFMIWYPVLAAGLHRRMLTDLRQSGIKDMLVSEICLEPTAGMYGSGVIVVNPPFGYEATLEKLTGHIAAGLGPKTTGSVYWLDNRKIDPETGLVAI